MRYMLLCALLLAGCASTPREPPQIQRISPEELELILPKPVPNLTLEEIVTLSKAGESADAIIANIRQTNSRYELTPSQVIELHQQGVDARVLDHMQAAREQALRDSFADEINKREREHQDKVDGLKRQLLMRSYPYCDPFWPYPYWRHPYYPYYW
jgi:hypothetical protein